MRVIGVIDIAGGIAVHARGGVRREYRPVLAPGEAAGDVEGLLRFYQRRAELDTVYVADLDAIAGKRLQPHLLERVAARGMAVWLDAAFDSVPGVGAALEHGAAKAVIGLETLSSGAALDDLGRCRHAGALVFSLDLRNGVPLSRGAPMSAMDPENIAAMAADAGFDTLIVLDVARVGMGAGLDLEVLRRVRAAVPHAMLIAGGGVRHVDDLSAAADVGCDAALVASALLDGRITAAEVHAISRR